MQHQQARRCWCWCTQWLQAFAAAASKQSYACAARTEYLSNNIGGSVSNQRVLRRCGYANTVACDAP
jgi:hypothetical protein